MRVVVKTFSPDLSPQFLRMQRVQWVAHTVFEVSSASMAEDSHGLKSTLYTRPHCPYLIPQSSTFQAVVGLASAEAVPEV